MGIQIMYFVTVPQSVSFLKGHLSYMAKQGYSVYIVSSPGEKLDSISAEEGVNKIPIPMERGISFKDIVSFLRILLVLLKIKPQMVNYGTPKAAFLASIASWITRVPIRIYTLRGLRFENTKYFLMLILIFIEKINCSCSIKIICISKSLEKKIIEKKIANKKKTVVLGSGSSNGVDINKFDLGNYTKKIKAIKKELFIRDDTLIIGYVGRINKDKGISELVKAYQLLYKEFYNLKLLLVGNIEKKHGLTLDIIDEINNNPNIIFNGYVEDPAPYYYIMDVFVFPTHREGFGNVSIEAAAASRPVVSSNATGATDTVIDGVTGFKIPVGDYYMLAEKVSVLLKDINLKNKFGIQGRKMVEKFFQPHIIWQETNKLYIQLLKERAMI